MMYWTIERVITMLKILMQYRSWCNRAAWLFIVVVIAVVVIVVVVSVLADKEKKDEPELNRINKNPNYLPMLRNTDHCQ